MDGARAFVTGHPMQDDADFVCCNHSNVKAETHATWVPIESAAYVSLTSDVWYAINVSCVATEVSWPGKKWQEEHL